MKGPVVSFDASAMIAITETAPIEAARHGWRAKCLQRLVRIGLPVPYSVAIGADAVRHMAGGTLPPPEALRELATRAGGLVSVRPSAVNPDWGGPGTVLNVGVNDVEHARLARLYGQEAADAIYLGFVQTYATQIARLDPDAFTQEGVGALERALAAYRHEMDEDFPQDPARQLADVLRYMARTWEGPTARILRQVRGAPTDAPLGLVVQKMAHPLWAVDQDGAPLVAGTGRMQFIDPVTGAAQVTGRFRNTTGGELYLTADPRGPSLAEAAPDAFADLLRFGELARAKLREDMAIEFVISGADLSILDAVKVARSSRAAVKTVVALAKDGIITKDEAVMRVDPRVLSDLLHYQVDPRAPRDVIARGINASPGAATGKIVFSASDAQAAAARGEACILVRRETTPEDIRGMHASVAVLCERGGTTSHAAVIARGLGLPCIVGASGIRIDARGRVLIAGGRSFDEGQEITIDGTTGEVLAGAAEMLEPALDDAFQTLLEWADRRRHLGVRANADTPEDARTARMFMAEGIGLCRTEHMFFDEARLPVMREMIFADRADDRRVALERLLPMQREDFCTLFEIMAGQPVTIRLFDPPLHEFLPHEREGMRSLAEALDLPLSDVTRRIEALREFNPMLGMRGVRLGITMPEIYEMQARAIFEAAVLSTRSGAPIVPEIMIPLVSARREVELVKTRIDAVAAAVRNEKRTDFTYRLGVMVETPRAALRAGDIAEYCSFLSFGTNDLTQMTYGLSRDDAGRFMGTYVAQGVYDQDPFHILDQEGVGELLEIGITRARAHNPDVTVSVCGEHGGNPESIGFCVASGISYVSCSPFRVPVARLAAAQFAIAANQQA